MGGSASLGEGRKYVSLDCHRLSSTGMFKYMHKNPINHYNDCTAFVTTPASHGAGSLDAKVLDNAAGQF